ncbi:MAG: aspartate-semialdehyde dehydrogenase [Candidatus Eisenbacteria bacterium]
MGTYSAGIVGATGAVGNEVLKILEEREFPLSRLELFASERSRGRSLEFRREKVPVRVLEASSVPGMDVVFLCAGGTVSKQYAPHLARHGSLVIDNSSAFRADRDIPLVIPEINGNEVIGRKGIVANPNCSTVQLVMAVAPIHLRWGIEQIYVATYQSVSGTGGRAMEELRHQSQAYLEGRPVERHVYPHQIAFNLFPHIGDFDGDGLNVEERKVVNETRRFLKDDNLPVAATCVRVPVFRSHSEAVFVVTKKDTSAAEVTQALRSARGVVLAGSEDERYATPMLAEGRDEVFVGRVRDTHPQGRGISMWVVSDNLRKGAALNAVQIAELALGVNVPARNRTCCGA